MCKITFPMCVYTYRGGNNCWTHTGTDRNQHDLDWDKLEVKNQPIKPPQTCLIQFCCRGIIRLPTVRHTDIHIPLPKEKRGNGQKWYEEGGISLQHSENTWHWVRDENMAFKSPGLFLAEVSEGRADIYLSDHSEKAWCLTVKRKDRKGSILSLPIFNMCLIPVLLASALKTAMKSLGGAKRWQSIPLIWWRWGNTLY